MGRGRTYRPVDRVLTVGYAPMAHQRPMHTSVARFKVIVGGRRSGKSKSLLHEGLRHCLETDNALAWWVAPTYAEAREIGFEEFMHTYPDVQPVISNLHRANMRVEFINGSKLYFKGADRRDSLRGRGLTFCILDEAAFLARDIWHKILRPALADRKGRAAFGTTPNGRNWLYALYQGGIKEGWERFLWPTQLNPLITQEEIDDMAADMSEMDYRQEVLAEFVTRSGQVYLDFNAENQIDIFKVNRIDHEIYISADFGYANPAAVLFFAVDKKTSNVVQWDEIYGARMTITQIESQIAQKLAAVNLNPRDVLAVYTDPAGNAEEITSGISPVDQLRKTYEVHNRGTEIAPGLALVRSFIRNALGVRKYFIVKKCVETIRSLEGYVYPESRGEVIDENPLKDGINDHCCDALRYFFVNRFDHARWLTSRIEQKSYTTQVSAGKKTLKRCMTCNGTFLSSTMKNRPPFMCGACEQKAAIEG